MGQEVLGRLHDLPEICLELEQDICIGEIATDHNNSKQLIDTYGTFALLYNWFPSEAQEIRQYTERPRSEFFAIRHRFLSEMLNQRWYAYEQTVVILLQAVFDRKRISPLLRRQHLRPAGRTRVPGLGRPAGGAHRARPQVALAGASRNHARLEPAVSHA